MLSERFTSEEKTLWKICVDFSRKNLCSLIMCIFNFMAQNSVMCIFRISRLNIEKKKNSLEETNCDDITFHGRFNHCIFVEVTNFQRIFVLQKLNLKLEQNGLTSIFHLIKYFFTLLVTFNFRKQNTHN